MSLAIYFQRCHERARLDLRLRLSIAKMVTSPNVFAVGTAETALKKFKRVNSMEAVFAPKKALCGFRVAMAKEMTLIS